jgi:hypothetical protein
MDSLRQQLLAMGQKLVQGVIAWAPKILLGVVVVILALVVAKVIEKVLRSILVRLRFDALLEKVGIDQALQKIGLRQEINQVVPRAVYFLLLFLFAKTAADAAGLVAISDAIGAFMAYLPNVIAAALILVLGGAAASFAGTTVAAAAGNAGIDFAPALGRIVSGVLLFVLGMMAVGQLQIDTVMIRLVTTAVLAALALAFGLSFGLGSREVTRNIIAGFYARKTFTIGEELEVSGERGILTAITPTQTLLEREGQTVAVANSVFLDQVVKQ